MTGHRLRWLAAALLGAVAVLVTASCAKRAGVLFAPVERAPVWPGPPEPARIHWIGQLATEADLKPAVPFGKALGQAVFGKDSVRSMLSPYAACSDGGQRVFVADSNGQVVHVFRLDTRVYERWQPAKDR